MKKFFKGICYFLTAALLLASLAACGGDAATGGTSAAGETTASVETSAGESAGASGSTVQLPADLPSYRIGVMYFTFTDKLGSQMKNALDYLAEAFNIEFVYIEATYSSEAGQAALETALQTGLDGVIAVSSGVAFVEACKTAGDVPCVSIQIEPNDDQVAQDMAAYDCYLGAVCENDYQVGVNAAEALYASGVRNLGICGLTPGLARSHDDRIRGVKSVIDKYDDLTLSAEDYTMAEYAKSISSFAAAYPEMDGLFASQGVETIYQTMNTEGLIGSVKLATVDISESTGDYFDNGTLISIAGGQYGTTMVGFALLYNYLCDGTRIIPDTSVTLRRPFIEVTSSEEFQDYLTYVDGDVPVYTVDEVAAMIHGFNPEAGFETYTQAAADYSLADIVARHGDLF
jgi:hypothetical protein